jgi:hypothetical protein
MEKVTGGMKHLDTTKTKIRPLVVVVVVVFLLLLLLLLFLLLGEFLLFSLYLSFSAVSNSNIKDAATNSSEA